jgi:hypothetical protein
MEWLLLPALAIPVTIFGIGTMLGHSYEMAAQRKKLEVIARELGIQVRQPGKLRTPYLRGEIDGRTVELRPTQTQRGDHMAELSWIATATCGHVGGGTSLRVREESDSPIVRALDWRDVECGDAAFDERFFLSGSDADVVRGLFSIGTVRAEIEDAWDRLELRELILWTEGFVSLDARREEARPERAAAVVRGAVALAVLLDEHKDVKPRLPPRKALPDGGQGGASGAPVGVRT